MIKRDSLFDCLEVPKSVLIDHLEYILKTRHFDEYSRRKHERGDTRSSYIEHLRYNDDDDEDARLFCLLFQDKYGINIVLDGKGVGDIYLYRGWAIEQKSRKPPIQTKYKLCRMCDESPIGSFKTFNDFIFVLELDNIIGDFYYIQNARTHSIHLYSREGGYILSIDPEKTTTDPVFRIPCNGKLTLYLISNYTKEGADRSFQKYILDK